jgi:hypothetical protein
MEGLVCGDSDAAAEGVYFPTVRAKAQAAKVLLHLQHFELASSLLLELGNQWFQVFAWASHAVFEPSIREAKPEIRSSRPSRESR